MPDILYLISKWWKQMLALLILSLLIVGAIVYMQPSRYLSVATALPASSVLTDKGAIFNNNVQQLYSSIGNPDDLDKILGTARLDTIYLSVTRAYNLWDHYKIDGPDYVARSAEELRKYSKVFRSEYGELKVKVWDTDKNLAPQLADEIMSTLNKLHQALQNESNRRVVMGLKESRAKLEAALDSGAFTINPSERTNAQTSIMLGQLQQYDELIGQYQLTIDTKPAALVIVENGRPALHPDTPKRVMILVATAILSLFFGLLMALVLERRKKPVL